MPRKPRKPKQIEVGVPAEVIETEREMAALEPLTSEEIRESEPVSLERPHTHRQVDQIIPPHIPAEPVDAKDVFDEVIEKAKSQETQQQRRWSGRSTLGFYTPDRGAVRVMDEGNSVGIQMDEKPSAEELKILRESRGEERGLSWNSVRGMNFRPTNGHPIRARLDVEQRAEEIARGRGWRSAVDEQRSEPEERSR